MAPIRFEAGLATLLRDDRRGDVLGHLSLAGCTGLSDRAEEWLRQRLLAEPEGKAHFGWFGRQSLDQIVSIWEALCGGNAREIRNVVRAAVPDELQSTLSLAFNSAVPPLVLLRQGAVLRALHDELPQALAGDFARRAALDLGACGDWENALAILERAHRDGANPRIGMAYQSLLWKHAYLQGHVETVLPRLAAIPFNRELAHAADLVAWQLLAYRIRAGRTDLRVPAVGRYSQLPTCIEAVAIQIAALEDVAEAADIVRELRSALVPTTIGMQFVDQGISVELEPVPDALFAARVRIAARRRAYSRLSALAQSSSRSLIPPSAVVIDALIEEGDWRAAADFADRHDPRDQAVPEGFDDARMRDYSELQLILSAAAARSGDDAAAQPFLSRHVEAVIVIREADRVDGEEDEGHQQSGVPGLWPATLLAGAAEGLLPRHFLAMLLPVFRGAY